MLRITKQLENEQAVLLRLEGKIDNTTLPELEGECQRYRDGTRKTVLLDFSGVTFISQGGLRLLQKIKGDRIKLAQGSLFVEALLSGLKD